MESVSVLQFAVISGFFATLSIVNIVQLANSLQNSDFQKGSDGFYLFIRARSFT